MTMHTPPHPEAFVWETYLELNGISVRSLAESFGVTASAVTRLDNGQSGMSPEMTWRLAKALGRPPESWLAMQHAHDLWGAWKSTGLSSVEQIHFGAP